MTTYPRRAGRFLPALVLAAALAAAFAVRAQSALLITAGPSVAASEIGPDSAVVRWSTSEAATTVVRYGTSSALGQSQRKIVIVPGAPEEFAYEISHSLELRELQPDTQYFYAVESATEDGRTVTSPQATFRTKAPPRPLLSVRITFQPPAAGSVAPPIDLTAVTDGPAASVDFVVRTAAGTQFTKVGASSIDSGRNENWNFTLRTIPPGDYRVTAEAAGTDAAGATVSYTSAPVAFTVAPACTEDVWECTTWGACLTSTAGAFQSRTCTLKTDCPGVTTARPAEKQSCTPACSEDAWACDPWGECKADGTQARTCTLKTDCPGVTTVKPTEKQSCTPPCTEDVWSCGEWGECVDDAQKRGCEMTFDCPGVSTPKPPTEQVCRTDIVLTNEPSVDGSQVIDANAPLPVSGSSGTGAGAALTALDGAGLLTTVQVPQEPNDPNQPQEPEYSVALIGVEDDDAREFAVECREAGVAADRCAVWLEARHRDRRCAAQGIFVRESCERYLTDLNGGTFPGCEGATAEACDDVKKRALFGYLGGLDADKLDGVVSDAVNRGVVVPIPTFTSVRDEAVDDAVWYPTAASPDGRTAPAVVMFDADRDGLSDDLEKAQGTDPSKADSDGDGASDADELKAGTNPAGEGDLPRPLDPTAKALVARAPLEQPLVAGEVDDAFTLNIAPYAAGGDHSALQRISQDANEPIRDANEPLPVEDCIRSCLKDCPKSGPEYVACADGCAARCNGDIGTIGVPPRDINEPTARLVNEDVNQPVLGTAVQVPYSGQLAEDGELVNAPPAISGRALPNTTVLVYVYSYIPMVLSAQTDENGDFTIDLAENVIADGEHTAYVVVTDETGKIEKKSNPVSFFVKEAVAVTEDEFLAPDLAPVSVEPVQAWQRYYLFGVVALVLVAMLIGWRFVAKLGVHDGPKPPEGPTPAASPPASGA